MKLFEVGRNRIIGRTPAQVSELADVHTRTQDYETFPRASKSNACIPPVIEELVSWLESKRMSVGDDSQSWTAPHAVATIGDLKDGNQELLLCQLVEDEVRLIAESLHSDTRVERVGEAGAPKFLLDEARVVVLIGHPLWIRDHDNPLQQQVAAEEAAVAQVPDYRVYQSDFVEFGQKHCRSCEVQSMNSLWRFNRPCDDHTFEQPHNLDAALLDTGVWR